MSEKGGLIMISFQKKLIHCLLILGSCLLFVSCSPSKAPSTSGEEGKESVGDEVSKMIEDSQETVNEKDPATSTDVIAIEPFSSEEEDQYWKDGGTHYLFDPEGKRVDFGHLPLQKKMHYFDSQEIFSIGSSLMKPIRLTPYVIIPEEGGITFDPDFYRHTGLTIASVFSGEEVKEKYQSYLPMAEQLQIGMDVEPVDVEYKKHIGEGLTCFFIPIANHLVYGEKESYILQVKPISINKYDKSVIKALEKYGNPEQTLYEPVAYGLFDFVYYPKDREPDR